MALITQDKVEEGIKFFREAIQIEPGMYCRMELAIALEKQGRLTEAAAEYREAIKLMPADAFPYNALAWLLVRDPGPAPVMQRKLSNWH